jgi:hypothetical protein
MQSKTMQKGSQAKVKPVEFRSIPNMLPSPSQLKQIFKGDRGDSWEHEKLKQSYSTAFHRNFRLHLEKHYNEHEKTAKQAASDGAYKQMKIRDHGTFVHLFAAPLFKIVAANWARLVVRRSFDLDLLEWRPKERVTSRTIDEIKSRRIAITRHQQHINSGMEALRALMLEEQELELKRNLKMEHGDTSKITVAQLRMTVDSLTAWNRGRSNGLVSQETNDDSWESIFWDFVELKASIDALEKRATQIQDGLCGQIQVVGGEKSSILNYTAFTFTTFSIVGAIYGANLKHGEREAPSKQRDGFILAVFLTSIAALVMLVILSYQPWDMDTIGFKVKELGKKFVDWTVEIFHHRKLKRNDIRWQTNV